MCLILTQNGKMANEQLQRLQVMNCSTTRKKMKESLIIISIQYIVRFQKQTIGDITPLAEEALWQKQSLAGKQIMEGAIRTNIFDVLSLRNEVANTFFLCGIVMSVKHVMISLLGSSMTANIICTQDKETYQTQRTFQKPTTLIT